MVIRDSHPSMASACCLRITKEEATSLSCTSCMVLPSSQSEIGFANLVTNLGFRLAVFYGALFVVYGMHVPYTPVWLEWRGLTPGQISFVMAAPAFLRLLITPAVALAADVRGNHRAMLIWLAWAALVSALALSQSVGFALILVFTVLLILCNSTIMPLTETIAVMGVRHAGLDYGRMRLWGSLTFLFASFIGGLAIEHFGGGAGVWLVVLGCVMTLAGALFLPLLPAEAEEGVTPAPIWQAREPRALLSSPAFILFLLAAGGAQAAHATFLTFGTLIWKHQGLSGGWAGALWAIGVLCEVAIFARSGALIAKIGPVSLLMAGAAVSVLRWGLMAFDLPLPALIAVQTLHGVTYGATHVAAIHFIHQAVPRSASGSAQALYATVSAGLAMGLATLIAGQLYADYGAPVSYLAMAVIALLSLAAAWRLSWVWDGQPLIAGDQRPKVELEASRLPPC